MKRDKHRNGKEKNKDIQESQQTVYNSYQTNENDCRNCPVKKSEKRQDLNTGMLPELSED